MLNQIGSVGGGGVCDQLIPLLIKATRYGQMGNNQGDVGDAIVGGDPGDGYHGGGGPGDGGPGDGPPDGGHGGHTGRDGGGVMPDNGGPGGEGGPGDQGKWDNLQEQDAGDGAHLNYLQIHDNYHNNSGAPGARQLLSLLLSILGGSSTGQRGTGGMAGVSGGPIGEGAASVGGG